MSSELAQTERAFQKQPTVVYNIKKGSTGAHAKRYVRSVGLGYKVSGDETVLSRLILS